MFAKDFIIACTSVLALWTTQTASAPLTPAQFGDFDRYILALSWQTGFCQSQYDRMGSGPDECRSQKERDDKREFLTIHGLWPGLPKSVSARGVDERRWMRFGCATRPVPNYPEAKTNRKCAAEETGISLEVANKLNRMMPASGGKSCLERYEYAKHGVCFGFDPDAYFSTMVRMNDEVRNSPIGEFLTQNYGKTVSRSDFNNAVASTWGKQAPKAIKLSCSGKLAYLTEMQISIKAAAINAPLSADSLLPQSHPGNCGSAFVIDKVGF